VEQTVDEILKYVDEIHGVYLNRAQISRIVDNCLGFVVDALEESATVVELK
jgi:hypothetical protein